MSARSFDKKFGDAFLSEVPSAPGVYRCFDDQGELVYVGKAVDLRRRLRQYRNATRKKGHRKMLRIVKATARIELEVTADEREALLLEDALIKAHSPRLNVAGAFSFMYPFLGLKRTGDGDLHLACSTRLEPLKEAGFRPFGCYRNRLVTRSGFDALVSVLETVGHRTPAPERLAYTAWRRFRQVPRAWDAEIAALLLGESDDFVRSAFMALLEKEQARRSAAEVQQWLRDLRGFYAHECLRMRTFLDQQGGEYLTQEAWDAAAIRAVG